MVVDWPRADRDTQRAAAQRRADALGLLAERALAVGFASSPISGSRAERYQVVLHVEQQTLAAEGEGEAGRSELEDGTRVSAETSRRLSCDAGVVRIRHGPDGAVLNVGRRTRTISPALRRALEARDGGCRFPGCGLRFTDAHHVQHWADGGETSLDNCVLVCKHHHRLLHEGGWSVGWLGRGRVVFFGPRGGAHYDGRWRMRRDGRGSRGEEEGEVERLEPPGGVAGSGGPGWGEGGSATKGLRSEDEWAKGGSRKRAGDGPEAGKRLVDALIDENRRRGVEPDGWTAGARWKREADIPDRIYFRAVEALQEAGS